MALLGMFPNRFSRSNGISPLLLHDPLGQFIWLKGWKSSVTMQPSVSVFVCYLLEVATPHPRNKAATCISKHSLTKTNQPSAASTSIFGSLPSWPITCVRIGQYGNTQTKLAMTAATANGNKDGERPIREKVARSTLATLKNAVRILHKGKDPAVFLCSDPCHTYGL